jgi:superfamily I DNA and/or RNA helicase
VILVSFVRSNNKGKIGRLLEDKRRINVAITRAKQKMILVGSFSTLRRGSPTLQVIVDQIKQQGRVVSVPTQF